ncbi:MAG: hypothetical protein GX772_11355, partial [Alcaligenaceae bacterium]|nr:hypothetical protein [Alcaligenaceae bacterium]
MMHIFGSPTSGKAVSDVHAVKKTGTNHQEMTARSQADHRIKMSVEKKSFKEKTTSYVLTIAFVFILPPAGLIFLPSCIVETYSIIRAACCWVFKRSEEKHIKIKRKILLKTLSSCTSVTVAVLTFVILVLLVFWHTQVTDVFLAIFLWPFLLITTAIGVLIIINQFSLFKEMLENPAFKLLKWFFLIGAIWVSQALTAGLVSETFYSDENNFPISLSV